MIITINNHGISSDIPPYYKIGIDIGERLVTYVNQETHFKGEVYTRDDINIAKYKWDFDGDENYDLSQSEPNATYIYNKTGEYLAKLTIVTNTGYIKSRKLKVIVKRGSGDQEYVPKEKIQVAKSKNLKAGGSTVEKYAIIINGGSDVSKEATGFFNDANMVYDMLKNTLAYEDGTNNNIIWFNPDVAKSNVDAEATRENIINFLNGEEITTYNGTTIKLPDQIGLLFIYTTGHGGGYIGSNSFEYTSSDIDEYEEYGTISTTDKVVPACHSEKDHREKDLFIYNKPINYQHLPDKLLTHDANNNLVIKPQYSIQDTNGNYTQIDINMNNNYSDWVSIDENIVVDDMNIYDNTLKKLLNNINSSFQIVVMGNCFSGGFIDDLSREKRIIMTACSEEDLSRYSEYYDKSYFTGSFVEVVNNNPNGSIKQIFNKTFNMAMTLAQSEQSEMHPIEQWAQYDDNGDGRATPTNNSVTSSPLPDNNDGCIGDKITMTSYVEYNLTLNEEVTENKTETALNSIMSSETISGANVTYKAGKSIKLTKGFSVSSSDSYFHGYLLSCKYSDINQEIFTSCECDGIPVANAGPDTTALCAYLTYTLEDTDPSAHDSWFNWSVESTPNDGQVSSWEDKTKNTTDIKVSNYGSYTFKITEENLCGYDEDKVDIDFAHCGGCGTITDADGKTYNTVKIGDNCWMAENLEYWDGSTGQSWDSSSNDFGRYYNYPAAESSCPSGWRLPTKGETNELLSSANYYSSGNSLLEDGVSGFDATLSGYCDDGEVNNYYDNRAMYLTSTDHENYQNYVYLLIIYDDGSVLHNAISKADDNRGYCVRCIKSNTKSFKSYNVNNSKDGGSQKSFSTANDTTYSQVTVYPNPSDGNVNIQVDNTELPYTYILYNMGGIRLKTAKVDANTTTINLTNYPKGIYTIKIITNKRAITKQIIYQ